MDKEIEIIIETTEEIIIGIIITKRKEKTRNSRNYYPPQYLKSVHQVIETKLYDSFYINFFIGPKHFQREGHNYFFSKFEQGFEDMKGDWLEGRNFCREYCMDLVSLETQEENDFFIEFLETSKNI